ncbi:Beta-galactosidase 15 [Glycine soja]|uniref:beta-galactosidase n=1 Tax=Glycine soja TaxID=3848 RepID=A0A0B2R0W3_GLYSO|nr:Beta-galactosidase 15 [Glycine soja]
MPCCALVHMYVLNGTTRFRVWLHNMPNMEFRTNNTAYVNEMQTFTTLIVDKMRHENLFASQGGPIILAQYGNIMSEYGENGKQYVQWCAQLAESYKIGVPWVMCQQSDAPDPIINTCNGWYCDQFSPNSKIKPKMWTENWTGWFKNWGGPILHRTARDVAYVVARFLQYGGTFQNYYMYHGGTNFGRTSGGPYITTSYDYDAPLDEYGNKNQPKWEHLKLLHELLKSMEDVLTQGTTNHTDYGNLLTINAQTSIMVMKDNKSDNEEEPHSTLNWQWMHEPHVQLKDGQVLGLVSRKAAQLLDQKVVTNDTSDYLWYITRLPYGQNGKYSFTYEAKIKLKKGTNEISLLSGTDGLPNYGADFSNVSVGVCGPVQLVTLQNNTEVVKDITNNTWNYKVGLHGEIVKLYSPENNNGWNTNGLPTNRVFVWYKTLFKSPKGTDPVVVDLRGLKKGQAWVNGNNIGSFGVPEGECGSFKKSQCESPNALSILSKSCLGKQSCSVQVSQRMLGPTRCRVPQNQNKLAIEAVCESIAKK